MVKKVSAPLHSQIKTDIHFNVITGCLERWIQSEIYIQKYPYNYEPPMN